MLIYKGGDSMFTRIRKHATGANVAVVIALVFAMSGGAYAAKKYVITSVKQIKPSVVAQLKGKAGPAGKAGAQGPAGPAGKDGAQGLAGSAGKDGSNGADGAMGPAGVKGATGPTGPTGPTGAPWPAGGVLPPGATETGQWAVFSTAAKTGELRVDTISFPIPLASSPAVTFIKEGDPVPNQCVGGSVASPKAANGNLCVFEGKSPIHFGNLAEGVAMDANGDFAPATTGADLVFETKATGEVSAEGSWAVTGE
jgi:collagen triple helix repeat protein